MTTDKEMAEEKEATDVLLKLYSNMHESDAPDELIALHVLASLLATTVANSSSSSKDLALKLLVLDAMAQGRAVRDNGSAVGVTTLRGTPAELAEKLTMRGTQDGG